MGTATPQCLQTYRRAGGWLRGFGSPFLSSFLGVRRPLRTFGVDDAKLGGICSSALPTGRAFPTLRCLRDDHLMTFLSGAQNPKLRTLQTSTKPTLFS